MKGGESLLKAFLLNGRKEVKIFSHFKSDIAT